MRITRIVLTVALGMVGFLFLTYLIVAQPYVVRMDLTGIVPRSADPGRLRSHIRTLSEVYFPRDYKNLGNLEHVADYVSNEMRKAGARTSKGTFLAEGRKYRNVIANLGPDTQEKIVIGAHYDAYDEFPGADDNASGVAGLLELTRLLAHDSLPIGVELVAFTLEEPPYFGTSNMGSAIHAHSLKKNGVQVRAMISLEMIGYFSDEKGSQKNPYPLLRLFYPSTGNFIGLVANLRNMELVRHLKRGMQAAGTIPVYSINAPPFLPGIDWSDHLSFWRQGFPAVMITDTSFYRNLAYHTAGDTADRLDYVRMGQVVTALRLGVLSLAEARR